MSEEEPVDFERWSNEEVWPLDVAAALLLQREPGVTNIESLGLEELRLLEGPNGISCAEVVWNSEHSKEFALLLARLVDAAMAGTLKSNDMNVAPADLIFWAGTRDLIGFSTRDLVEAVGIHHLYDQIDPHEAANRLSISDAADYLSGEFNETYTVDRLIDLGLEHKIGIAVLTKASGVTDSGVRYIHASDLEAFKSYAFSPPVAFSREWKYLEDALIGPEHFRYYNVTYYGPQKSVNSISELLTSREQLEKYISQCSAEPKEPSLSGSCRETMDWVIQRAGGNKWSCGLENDLKLVRGTKGLEDLFYAVSNAGKDCDPLKYEGVCESQAAMAEALKYFSSEEEIDPQAIQTVREEIQYFEERIQASDNLEQIEKLEKSKEVLEDYLKTGTMPGGSSRKMNNDDPYVKATNAMRDRKVTVIKNLQGAGLDDLAGHVNACYQIHTKSFIYTGSRISIG